MSHRQISTGRRARCSGLGRSPAPRNRFPPELEWPPRREASVVTCYRASFALAATCLLDSGFSVCWQKALNTHNLYTKNAALDK